MKSYLSSFGATQSPAETEGHEIFKRSSKSRKVRKVKKIATTTTTTTEPSIEAEVHTKPLAGRNNGKNFTVSPRHIVKFEVDDAKYSEDYEKLKRSRKLRVRRSADDEKKTNSTRKFVTKETFVEPREFLRFSHLDAVTKSPEATANQETSEKKTKREVADSTATESKKVHMTSPMRGYRSTKHVSYDDIPAKLQKMIDSALHDAVQKGKANDGDYLKFFYGDNIIKVPVSMSKHISQKTKETKEKPKEPSYKEIDSTIYGKKIVSYPSEDSKEAPKLLATKNSYYPLKSSAIKYETKPSSPHSTTEKAESYANFETPIVVQQPDIQENKYLPYKKSVYYFANGDNYYPKNSITSPGPVLFDDVTPSSIIEDSKPHHYKSFVFHPPTNYVKDIIPITEQVDESFSYIPSLAEKSHLMKSIPKPTSYVEYAGNYANSHNEDKKSYEFGYVLRHTLKR